MTAKLLWDTTRTPVGPTYMNRGVSGDAIAVTFSSHQVPGQLWERVLESGTTPAVDQK